MRVRHPRNARLVQHRSRWRRWSVVLLACLLLLPRLPAILRGVRRLTMRDAARAAHISVAGLYHYFPTKRDLVLHSLRPDAFKRMCGDFMKESGHLQTEAPGRFLRAFVELASVKSRSCVRRSTRPWRSAPRSSG